MPAPLETFLHAYRSGNTVFSPEMYAHFGGEDLLNTLRKYDPNATWTEQDLGGGEGGSQGKGYRLDFDITKMPGSKLPNGRTHELFGLAPAQGRMLNDKYQWGDDLYGQVTDSRNLRKDAPAWWELVAPLAVSVLAPAAGAALMGSGIGLGVGGTSAVTGAAAGLGAGQIPGALGAGSSLGLSDRVLQLLGRSPSLGRQLANGGRPSLASSLPLLLRLMGR